MDYTIQTEHKGNFLEVHDYRNWQSKGATMNGSSGRAKRNPAEDAELLDLSQRKREGETPLARLELPRLRKQQEKKNQKDKLTSVQ